MRHTATSHPFSRSSYCISGPRRVLPSHHRQLSIEGTGNSLFATISAPHVQCVLERVRDIHNLEKSWTSLCALAFAYTSEHFDTQRGTRSACRRFILAAWIPSLAVATRSGSQFGSFQVRYLLERTPIWKGSQRVVISAVRAKVNVKHNRDDGC